jgi:hypothetical protein
MVISIASCQDLVASGSGDGMAIICDSGSGNVLQTIKISEQIDTVQFSSHGDNMMCTCWDLASIWDLGRKMRVLTTRLDGYHARFAPDRTCVTSLFNKFVKIWKPNNQHSSTKAVDHHLGKVLGVHFVPDSWLLASQSFGEAKIWDGISGECLFTFNSALHPLIIFSPNLESFACKLSLIWEIWNVRTHSLVRKVYLYSSLIALSPDGTRVADVNQGI